MEYLVDPETLVKMTGRTLEERVMMWRRRFPGTKKTLYYLRKAYKEAGVKLRKIAKTKIVSPQQAV